MSVKDAGIEAWISMMTWWIVTFKETSAMITLWVMSVKPYLSKKNDQSNELERSASCDQDKLISSNFKALEY